MRREQNVNLIRFCFKNIFGAQQKFTIKATSKKHCGMQILTTMAENNLFHRTIFSLFKNFFEVYCSQFHSFSKKLTYQNQT